MFDETVFTNFMMDMVTLEATMTVYDYEHGLTPEYLASGDDVTYDDFATEAASGSIVDGLFEDDFVATEGFKETMGNIGKGIKTAAITVIGAIKKAFVTLGNNIAGFFSAAIERHQRASAHKDPYVFALMRNENVRAACSTAMTAFKSLNAVVAEANTVILPIVNKINKAFNSAGIGNSSKATVSADDLEKINNSVVGSYGMRGMDNLSDKKKGDKAFKSDFNDMGKSAIKDAEDMLKKLQDALKKAQNVIDAKDNAVARAMNTALGKVELNEVVRSEGDNEKAAGEYYNKKGEKKETKIEKKVSPALVQKAIFMNIEVSAMHAISKQITAACSQHAKACDNIIKTADKLQADSASQDVKDGYRLCQIYMRSSNYFSQISMMCTKIISFKSTDIKKLGEDD